MAERALRLRLRLRPRARRAAGGLNVGAPYLPSPDDPGPNPGFLTPENSRRARGFAVWATLRAYGRDGHRAMVERHLRLARHLGERVDAEPELERLADVNLNIVCFRARPDGRPGGRPDEFNASSERRCWPTAACSRAPPTYDGQVALRPAIVNWQTTEADVDLLIDVLLELMPAQG